MAGRATAILKWRKPVADARLRSWAQSTVASGVCKHTVCQPIAAQLLLRLPDRSQKLFFGQARMIAGKRITVRLLVDVDFLRET